MRTQRIDDVTFLSIALAGALLGCAAGQETTGGGGQGGGQGAAGPGPSTGGGGGEAGMPQGGGGAGAMGGSGSVGGFGGLGGDGGAGGFLECATFTEEASQAPAAILFVLDKSASMTTANKWGTAQLAVVSAIDKDAFDSLSLGLVTFPSSFSPAPQCLCDYCCGGDPGLCGLLLPQGVSCGVSGLPQVAIAPAGTQKSNQGGVRQQMYQYLVNNAPLSNSDDGSPIYEALVSGYNALHAIDIEQRILVLLTDGGFSCTSVSTPPRPGYSDGACLDWEYPDSVNALITSERNDAAEPIYTFVVGLPGSNSTGQMQGSFATAPYPMRRALSSYAFNGAPDSVDPLCDMPDALFNVNGGDPALGCHIDLSSGAGFNADSFADAIEEIRGEALGCVYDLPQPPPGETIDPAKVNVNLVLDGVASSLPKRSDPMNDCELAACWDYTNAGKVELVGKACTDLSLAGDASVEIVVGCDTVVQ